MTLLGHPNTGRLSDAGREGVKLLGEHIEDCRAQHDAGPFITTDRNRPHDFNRKKNGHRGGGTMWWQFVCNDTRCRAKLLVRWDVLARFVNGTEGEA